MTSLPDCVSRGDLDAVLTPIDNATGLPNACYTQESCYTYERDAVLASSWAGLEFSSALPAPGYVKPVDFMGLPLLMTRDNASSVIRVFHNVCSHRGMKLVPEEGQLAGSIRCPYHSWSYAHSGELKGTPHIGGIGQHTLTGFDPAGHGLREIPSAEWMGVVFINIDGKAGSFDDFIAPVVTRWEALAGSGVLGKVVDVVRDEGISYDLNCNWKLAIDNYCEAYHLPWIHPDLNSYSPLDQHAGFVLEQVGSGQISFSYTLAETAGIQLPCFEAWPEDRLAYAEYLSLYPNVLLGIQADHVFALLVKPKAAGKTREQLEIRYPSTEVQDSRFDDARAAVREAWRLVFSEDVGAVEGMQKGRSSPAYRGGVFSSVMEVPTHHFHNWVARRYLQRSALQDAALQDAGSEQTGAN